MKLTEAIEKFLVSYRAGGKSNATVDLYEIDLTQLANYLEDPEQGSIELDSITLENLEEYMVYLQDEYVPQRKNGDTSTLAGNSLRNHVKAIRALFTWAVEREHLKNRPDKGLKLPKDNPRAILPLEREEVMKLMRAAEFTKQAETKDERKGGKRKAFKMARPTAARDRALIQLMVDIGLRAGEVCRLKVKDVDLEKCQVEITPYGNSRKKTDPRPLWFGKTARRYLEQYLASRPDLKPNDPLFPAKQGGFLNSSALRHLVMDLGKRAGVKGVHPHRLRHTYSVEHLRNGGDIKTLKYYLGHESLEMVERYVKFVDADYQRIHRLTSPADNWGM